MARRKPRPAEPDPAGTVDTTVDTKAVRRPRKGRRGGNLGRPPIVADPDRVTSFLNAIRAGVPIGAACDHAGIHPASHRRAMDAGAAAADQEDRPDAPDLTERQREYRDYRAEFLRARAGVAVINVALVAKAAQGGALISETVKRYRDDDTGEMVTETTRTYSQPAWPAAKFLLQTSFREDFATQQRRQLEVSGPQGGPVQLAGDEVLLPMAERLRRVAERQSNELPGGWEPDERDDDGVLDAELVDDEGDDG